MDSRPFRPLPDTPRPNFNFFAFQKKRFFNGILLIKIPIQRFFIDFYQDSILCLPPFCFNSSFHKIWNLINQLCVSSIVLVSNVFQYILHMSIDRLGLRSFHASLHLLAQVQNHMKIMFLKACNHYFAEGNYFLCSHRKIKNHET